MNGVVQFAASLLAGSAVAIGVWSGRGWIMARYERDVAWMADTYRRFRPQAINARAYTLGYYGIFLAWLVLLWIVLPSLIIALALWIATWFVPGILVSWAWKRRLTRIDLQIPQTVATLANSMRAGLTLVQAVTRISEQAPEPIRSEFQIMANQYGYGADMETVIRNAKERLNLQNFSLFASALLLNRQMGGDISETLTRISKSLDKLREMKKTVEAHTSEGRANIKILLAAPVFILAVMSLVVPRGVGLLFTTAQGWAILLIAGLLAGTGVYLANRITRSEV